MNEQPGVVTHNVAALRAEPQSGAEMVSQAVMGDPVTLLEERGGFVRVRAEDDGYEGWARANHVRPCPAGDPFALRAGGRAGRLLRTVCDFTRFLSRGNAAETPDTILPRDARVVALPDPHRITAHSENRAALLADGREGWLPASAVEPPCRLRPSSGRDAARLAAHFFGTPYLWGGTTPFGFDCSGLVQRAYKVFGVLLPRDAYQQIASPHGVRLPEGTKLQAGDLAFFRNFSYEGPRPVNHVGILMDAENVVHAYGPDGVIVSPLSGPLFSENYAYKGAWRLRRWADDTPDSENLASPV